VRSEPVPRRCFQLVERFADEFAEVALAGFVDPALTGGFEERDRDLGGEGRRWVVNAASPQRVGDRGGECCELGQLSLLELALGGSVI